MLDPDSLRAFIAVFEHAHFVRAADSLEVTQSVVSKRLHRLEDQLGTRLIDRGKRQPVQPTRAGTLFIPEAKRVLAELERAERLGKNLARGAAGPIRIGYVFSAIITGVLPRMIRRLQHVIPGIEIEPKSMETPEQLTAISAGKLDFGIIRPRPTYPEGVVATAVHRERVILAVSSDHALAGSLEIRPEDLADIRFVVPQFHEEVGIIDVIRGLARAGRFTMPEIVRTADFITAAGLAAAGVGVAAVPSSLARVDLEGLQYRVIKDHNAWMDLMLISRADAPKAAADALLSCVAQSDYEDR